MVFPEMKYHSPQPPPPLISFQKHLKAFNHHFIVNKSVLSNFWDDRAKNFWPLSSVKHKEKFLPIYLNIIFGVQTALPSNVSLHYSFKCRPTKEMLLIYSITKFIHALFAAASWAKFLSLAAPVVMKLGISCRRLWV